MASRWWTLLAVCLSIFMLLLDITRALAKARLGRMRRSPAEKGQS
jgi:hypothetical protein